MIESFESMDLDRARFNKREVYLFNKDKIRPHILSPLITYFLWDASIINSVRLRVKDALRD